MLPDKIKSQLLDYYQQFRANLGLFKSFEIIFNYINFIKSEPYTKDLLGSTIKYTEEQYYSLLDIAKDAKKTTELEKAKLSILEPTSFAQFPLFNKELSSIGMAIENKESRPLADALPMYLFCLIPIVDGFQKIKDFQAVGDNEEVERLIKIMNEEAFSVINFDKIEGFNPFTLMSPQVVGTAIEMVNKYIFDHIDSQSFLDNEKPVEPLSFDQKASVLYIHGRAIKITLKNNPPVGHYILEALFQNEDLSEKAYFSEIAKDFDKEEYNGNWQRYRHACENLNQKIAKATNNKINDFIDFTTGITGWCKINYKYL